MSNEIMDKKCELNPYDPLFPVQYFKDNIGHRLAKAEIVIHDVVNELIQDGSLIAQSTQSLEKGYRLVVDISDDMLRAIDEGKIRLSASKEGQVYAQLLRADGKYDKKLPIKKEMLSHEFDEVELANALQLKALQKQLDEISEQIVLLDRGIQEVLKGQQNDRIGLYYSAISLIVEAMAITDSHLKEALMVQGLRSLSDSIFQLTLKLRDDIQFLKNKEYESIKGKRRVTLIEEKIQSINHTFAFIHQGMILKAGSYFNLDQIAAMSTVLKEYSRFIENDIKPNSFMLSQYDSADSGLVSGIWKSRALLSFDSKNFDNLLDVKNNEQELYISLNKEK